MAGYRVPVVNYTGPDAPATYLAGGNFGWLKEGIEGTEGWDMYDVEVDYDKNPFSFRDPEYSSLDPSSAYTTTGARVAYISCHRPHGSPYPDMLRWYPETCEGCISCHSQKSFRNGPCNKCHNMHYSQDGVSLGSIPEWPTEGPYHSLLTKRCLDCHSSGELFIDVNPKAGWSMISLPVIPESPVISELFPEAVVIYGYEKEFGYKRIMEKEELEVGKGYWILFGNITDQAEFTVKKYIEHNFETEDK